MLEEATAMYQRALPNLVQLPIEGVNPEQVTAFLSGAEGSAMIIALLARKLEQDAEKDAARHAAPGVRVPAGVRKLDAAPVAAAALPADARWPAHGEMEVIAYRAGEVLVTAPKTEAFRLWSRSVGGKWSKELTRWHLRVPMSTVQEALVRIYGTDGAPVPVTGLRFTLTASFLHQHLFRWTSKTNSSKTGWTLSLHRELASSSSGTGVRLQPGVRLLSGSLPNVGAILSVGQVPQPLAARLAAEDPASYTLVPAS